MVLWRALGAVPAWITWLRGAVSAKEPAIDPALLLTGPLTLVKSLHLLNPSLKQG